MKKVLFSLLVLADVFACYPTKAMKSNDEQESPTLRTVKGKSIPELRQIRTKVVYDWIPESLGNMLNINAGELKVTCPSIENEGKILGIYQTLNKEIKNGIVQEGSLEVNAPSQEHVGARCVGESSLKLTSSDELIGKQALFGSKGNIDFTASKFDFETSFVDVNPQNTIVRFYPHTSLNSPIEYLTITPKKTPLFIQGEIDFKNLSFKGFIVSHSQIDLQFKKL